MVLRHAVRDLLLASWETDAERVAAALPPGFTPAPVDGRHLVTVAALRWRSGRLGMLPLVPFSQLNVRVYVEHGEETAVFFLALRTTLPGLGGALLGIPVRAARIRVRAGLVHAGGLGVSIPFEPRGPAEPSELGQHAVGLYEAAGVRAFRIRRGEASWRRAEPTGPVRADPLLALGFSLEGPPALRYAERASFEAELPPVRIPPRA